MACQEYQITLKTN